MPTSTLDTILSQEIVKVTGLSISVDLVIIAALFVVVAGLTLWLGKNGGIALIVGLYIGLLLYINFPYASTFLFWKGTPLGELYSYALMFAAFTGAGFLIARRFVLAQGAYNTTSGLPEALVLALGITAFLLALSYHVIPIDPFYNFAPNIDRFFTSSTLFFWWLLAPLASLLFVTRRF